MIGLDTTAIIDFFKKDITLKKLLDNLEDNFATTIINYQEIFFGLKPEDPKYKLEKEHYENFFNNIILFDFDKASAIRTSHIFWELGRKETNIGKFDLMIAGTLLNNGVNKIITKNVKHFQNIKGLKVMSYREFSELS